MPRWIQIETSSRDQPPKRDKRKTGESKGSHGEADIARGAGNTAGGSAGESDDAGASGGRVIGAGWWVVALLALVVVVVGGYWLGSRAGGEASAAGTATAPGGLLSTLTSLIPGVGGGGVSGGAAPGAGTLATINGQALTERDIDVEQAVQKVLQAQTGRVMSEDPAAQTSFRRELLSQVVDQVLLLQAAQAAGINPTDAEVDGELPRMLGQYGLDGATLLQRLLALGITEAEYRAWARRQVTNGRYVQSPAALQLAGGMVTSPEQVASALQTHADVVLYIKGQPVAPVKQGQPAPDFTLQTPDGQTVRLSELRGKPVMINFWATWCGPCQVEMPLFIDAYTKNKDKLVVLGVDVQEQPAQVTAFAQKMGLNFPLVIDPDGEVSTIYQVRGLPTTIFVNADGIVEAAHRGAILSRPQLEPYLAQILRGAEGG